MSILFILKKIKKKTCNNFKYVTLINMRQGKKERLKKQALNNIRVRNIRIPTSSIYNNLGLSTYSGMSKRSKFIHIKNNVENNIINRLDKLLKVC